MNISYVDISYADDTQYLVLKHRDSTDVALRRTEACVADISTWIETIS